MYDQEGLRSLSVDEDSTQTFSLSQGIHCEKELPATRSLRQERANGWKELPARGRCRLEEAVTRFSQEGHKKYLCREGY